MNILFITPPCTEALNGHAVPNLYYARLAAYVRQQKIADVQVLDCRVEKLDYAAMMERVKAINPAVAVFGDILFSHGGLALIWHFNESARLIKKFLPRTKTVMGGLWYSSYASETMQLNPQIDFILAGEGELTLVDLVLRLSKGKEEFRDIPGLASRDANGHMIMGPRRGLINDIESLPLPAFDLFPMGQYAGHNCWPSYIELMTSRGCPRHCHFCYQWSLYDPRSNIPDFTNFRRFSPKRINDELDVLWKEHGVKVVAFQDNTFHMDPERVKAFCEEKLRRGNPIQWTSLARADDWRSQRDMFGLMANSGLFMSMITLEQVHHHGIQRFGQAISAQEIKEVVDLLREQNVATAAVVLLGQQEDDEARVKAKLRLAEDIDADLLFVEYITPVPGSPVWRWALKEGLFNPLMINLKEWDFRRPVMRTNHLSIAALASTGSSLLRSFYSKPHRRQRLMENGYDPKIRLWVRQLLAGSVDVRNART